MRFASRLVLAGLLVLLLALQPAQALRSPAAAQAPADFEPGEILIKFKPGAARSAVADADLQNGVQEKETIPGIDVKVLHVPVGQEQRLVAALGHNPNVVFTEVNGRYETSVAGPNDPQVGQQWQYNNPNDKDIDA